MEKATVVGNQKREDVANEEISKNGVYQMACTQTFLHSIYIFIILESNIYNFSYLSDSNL